MKIPEYQLSEEQKKRFAGIYLLRLMEKDKLSFPVFLDSTDRDLEPILEWLLTRGWVDIKEESTYLPNAKGREVLKRFLERYSEYLTYFDIYCAVDLQSGEFAFHRWFDFHDQDKWREYLKDGRWDDLRVAVAEFKGLDAVEIVFMSYVQEHRFGRNETGWQFDLLLGSVWEEILNICRTAIHWTELAFEDSQGKVAAEDVIRDILTQGGELLMNLLEKERQMTGGRSIGPTNGGLPRFEPGHFAPYRDPGFLSTAWRRPWDE